MTDGAVCSLERPEEAEDLTAAEKAAIRYADLMAIDHLSIDDALFAELSEHFDQDARSSTSVSTSAHAWGSVG